MEGEGLNLRRKVHRKVPGQEPLHVHIGLHSWQEKNGGGGGISHLEEPRFFLKKDMGVEWTGDRIDLKLASVNPPIDLSNTE